MPSTSASKIRLRSTAGPARSVALWMAVAWFAMSSASTAQEQIAAIFKAQEINFTYHSRTAIYACGALRSRVVSLLRAVGAEQDLNVSVTGCDDFIFPSDVGSDNPSRRFNRFSSLDRDPGQFAQVRIRLRSPIAATPEAIAELEKTKGYRELLGRVTNNSAAIQEAAAQFSAQRQLVSLSNRSLGLEPVECELIEQMIREVFPKLGVRVVKQSMVCIPRQVSLLKPRLDVEALIKTPLGDGSAQQSPTAVSPIAESDAPASSDAGAPPASEPPTPR